MIKLIAGGSGFHVVLCLKKARDCENQQTFRLINTTFHYTLTPLINQINRLHPFLPLSTISLDATACR